jgi:uncharacterized protein YndB with AHSA1/START domain
MLAGNSPEVVVTLPSDREILFTCVFRHPSQLLFEAWTEPEHLRFWQGCDSAIIIACEVDLRVGGAWSHTMRMPDGSEHPQKGVYREIVPNERLVYTSIYDVERLGRPECLITVTFEALAGGGTRLTHRILHQSMEMRDLHLKSGMEEGTRGSFRRLEIRAGQIGETRLAGDRL